LKNRILEKLKENKDYISGEELSRNFGVSRTAIWKHIAELRKDGYSIESSSKKGYRLTGRPDLLDGRELSLPEGQLIGSEIIHFEEIDSTNNYAKKIANEGCRHGTVVIAERQTLGRGRTGREWESFNSDGLWFTIVLRPELEPEDIQVVTLAASVAVVEGILDSQGVTCGIKWPNDIILDNCKLAGILTELSAEPGHVNYVVVGIGININQSAFNGELRDKATSLRLYTGQQVSRVDVLGKILTRFEDIYDMILEGNTADIISRWSTYSVTIGKEVKIIYKNVEYTGKACSIALDGKLVVECNDGEVRHVSAGEVQIRGMLGYV
jgi:BirA family biotin operon repressor/biotin-[acetyl-CoA-carboxylase] ligase